MDRMDRMIEDTLESRPSEGKPSGDRGLCALCDEDISTYDAWVPLNPMQYGHHECSIREVLGGIGHHLGHEYWCLQQRAPDAGLTYRQSAKMIVALIDVLGIDEVSKGSVVP